MVYGCAAVFPLRRGRADAQQRHKRRFGVRRVLPGRLAELIGGGGGVEHVVGNLKGEADRFAVSAQPATWRGVLSQLIRR